MSKELTRCPLFHFVFFRLHRRNIIWSPESNDYFRVWNPHFNKKLNAICRQNLEEVTSQHMACSSTARSILSFIFLRLKRYTQLRTSLNPSSTSSLQSLSTSYENLTINTNCCNYYQMYYTNHGPGGRHNSLEIIKTYNKYLLTAKLLAKYVVDLPNNWKFCLAKYVNYNPKPIKVNSRN